ncbi:MAG: class II aldolase/adducin family protein, partial [Rubripirellula sp.]
WGYKDPRNTPEYDNCDICANDVFRDSWAAAGVQRRAFAAPPAVKNDANSQTANTEDALVKAITDEVIRQMQTN